MRQFAFVSKRAIRDVYKWWLSTYRMQKQNMDLIKIWWVLLFLCCTAFLYFRFVSLASTRGYFLRQANNDLNAVNFTFQISKTHILDLKQENREQMQSSPAQKRIVNVQTEVVKIPTKTELTIR